MKKKLFFAAVALVAFASCTSDDFIGDVTTPQDNSPSESDAIVFSSASQGSTRANHIGADAADLLGGKFIVGGFKGNGSSMSEVFNNYYVTWTANSAGKTESNTSDWEYVGATVQAPSTLEAGAVQSIKYWDYSTSQYDFAAYSTGKLSSANVLTTGTPSAGQVLISPITKASTYAGPTYTLRGDVAALKECYISNMVTAYKASDYQKEVQLTFRNLSSKVRVALYETIPGYSVKDVNFYIEDNSSNSDIKATGTEDGQLNNTNVTLFTTGTEATDAFFESGIYTVTFPTIGSDKKTNSDYNMAHVSFTADATNGSGKTKGFGSLNYNANAENKEASGSYLGRASNSPSFAGTADPWYLNVLPNETGTVLELRINYTLLATDGSGEEIHIHGAKAFVPAIYAAWKPNFAYTYLFKISDNTNGWTNLTPTDPAGLYPITFDAIVIDSQDNKQTTVTTVATPSITTYQKGHDYADGDTYLASKGDIYVQVMKDGSLQKVNEGDDGKTCSVWEITTISGYDENKYPITEASVMDALNIPETATSGVTTGRNGIILTKGSLTKNVTTIPGVDGNNITVGEGDAAKFTPAAGKYAITYKYDATAAATNLYSAQTFTSSSSAPADWGTSGVWYEDPNGATAVSGIFVAPTGTDTKTYYKKYTNSNIIWGVKVIKVQ